MAKLTSVQARFIKQYLIPRGWKPPARPGLLTRVKRYLSNIIPAGGLVTDTGYLMPPYILACAAQTARGGVDILRERMSILLGLLRTNPKVWTREELMGLANKRLGADPSRAMNLADFQQAMECLVRELKAKPAEGGYRYYDQAVELGLVAESLGEKLMAAEDIYSAFKTIAEEMGDHFRYIELYLFDMPAGSYVQVLTVDADRSENEKYIVHTDADWHKAAGKSGHRTFAYVLERRLPFLFFENAVRGDPKKNPLARDWRSRFMAAFKDPRELMVLPVGFKLEKTEARVLGFLVIHQWRKKEDAHLGSPFYSLTNTPTEVNGQLQMIALHIAGCIAKLLRGETARSFWSRAASEIKRLQEPPS